jgi:hypothetical protein
MPNCIKVGMTQGGEEGIKERVRALSGSTGVPTPFICEGFIYTRDARATEAAVHHLLSDKRVNKKREFFKLSPRKALAILKGFEEKEQEQKILLSYRVFYREFSKFNLPREYAKLAITLAALTAKQEDILRIPGMFEKALLLATASLSCEGSFLFSRVHPILLTFVDLLRSTAFEFTEKGILLKGTPEGLSSALAKVQF